MEVTQPSTTKSSANARAKEQDALSLTLTRDQARESVTRTFQRALDKVLPGDHNVALPAPSLHAFTHHARAAAEAVYLRLLELHRDYDHGAAAEDDEDCAPCGAD